MELFDRRSLNVSGALKYVACSDISEYVMLSVSMDNTFHNKMCNSFFIGPIQQDIIIGLSDFRRHNLVLAVPELFFNNSAPEPVNVKDFEPDLVR